MLFQRECKLEPNDLGFAVCGLLSALQDDRYMRASLRFSHKFSDLPWKF